MASACSVVSDSYPRSLATSVMTLCMRSGSTVSLTKGSSISAVRTQRTRMWPTYDLLIIIHVSPSLYPIASNLTLLFHYSTLAFTTVLLHTSHCMATLHSSLSPLTQPSSLHTFICIPLTFFPFTLFMCHLQTSPYLYNV